LAAAASLVLSGTAIATHDPDLTDAEFKCQGKVSKAGSKFVGAKAKCASKCVQTFRKNVPGDGYDDINDCYAPYGGTTLACIADPLKGAEAKFALAIKKSCDPVTKPGADCPECYSGGDCSDGGEAGDRVANVENQVDSFGPGVFCEQPGADDGETKCELNTAKTLAKLVGAINKCYDKCNSNMHKAIIGAGQCNPPSPADGTTSTCITNARNKAILGVDKKCSVAGFIPDCAGTDDYPSGANWVNLVDIAIQGNVPGTYCGSPSGAFID
jgi:hypothetical protein